MWTWVYGDQKSSRYYKPQIYHNSKVINGGERDFGPDYFHDFALDFIIPNFTLVADKLNQMRYLSHFRSIHRGQYFMEMKTTSVRKLLPDSWGFLCPATSWSSTSRLSIARILP